MPGQADMVCRVERQPRLPESIGTTTRTKMYGERHKYFMAISPQASSELTQLRAASAASAPVTITVVQRSNGQFRVELNEVLIHVSATEPLKP
jgi:hypothetical protein